MFISVVIATRNRCQLLRQALDSLREQQVDGSFLHEVIVVDNGSKDLSADMVSKELVRWDGRLRYFLETKIGKSAALNTGIRNARGDIIALTDDDVIVDRFWLANLSASFIRHGVDMIGGQVMPRYPQGTPAWIKINARRLPGTVVVYDAGPLDRHWEPSMTAFIGANLAFKRSLMDAVGFFREDIGPGTSALGEDTEMVFRAWQRGHKLFYASGAIVHHPYDPERLRLFYIARWHVKLGRWAAMQEIESGARVASWWRLPRYLPLAMFMDVLRMPVLVITMQRVGFFNAWRGFFRKAGMIQVYLSRRARA